MDNNLIIDEEQVKIIFDESDFNVHNEKVVTALLLIKLEELSKIIPAKSYRKIFESLYTDGVIVSINGEQSRVMIDAQDKENKALYKKILDKVRK